MPESKKAEPVVKTTTTAKTEQVSRPWQGTVLGVIYILTIAMMVIMLPILLLVALGGSALGFMSNMNNGLAMLLGGGMLIMSLLLIAIFILQIFVIIGIFKGQKWAVITSIVFITLGLSSLIQNFSWTTLIIDGALMYLSIACLLHPFYGGKK